MFRREFTKSMVSLPFLTTIPSPVVGKTEERNEEEEEVEIEWDVRAVWKRRTETGILTIAETGEEFEFDSYQNWARKAIRKNSQYGSMLETVCICDFQLISMYSGDYARTHFAHGDAGLEVTLRHQPSEEVEYSAVVRSVDEKWDERDIYHSTHEQRLVEKILRVRDEHL